MGLGSRSWSRLLPPTPAARPGWSCFLRPCWRLVAPLSVPPSWTSFCWFWLENTRNRHRFTPEGKGISWHVREWGMSTRLWEQREQEMERKEYPKFLYPTRSRKGSYCIHLCLLLQEADLPELLLGLSSTIGKHLSVVVLTYTCFIKSINSTAILAALQFLA